jgi:hypothetical protein
MGHDAGSPSRSRTCNKPVNSRKVAGRKPLQDNSSGDGAPRRSAPLAQQTPADPGLACLCSAWATLPGHIKAAILALVATASPP